MIAKLMRSFTSEKSQPIMAIIVIIVIILIFVKTYAFFNKRVILITCNSNMTALRDALHRHKYLRNEPVDTLLDHNRMIKIDILRQKKSLNLTVQCPEQGQYFLDHNNKINCTIHGVNREE
ncbi:MAG: hypothetical protein ABH952_05300 [Candidatus Omnitrophota bacterium]